MLFSLFKFTLALNSVRRHLKRPFLCSTFALQLKTVLLLDVLQLLMLSAGTLMSLQDKMFHLNIFYYKQDIYCLYDISLRNSIVFLFKLLNIVGFLPL
jgi:hypothetical protein